jgi:uracil-DNA glycosylase family 4
MLVVGEQPGDQEDLAGPPLRRSGRVRMFDRVMPEAGLDRSRVLYVTNAVKHFKFESERGKRRIHESPDMPARLQACRWWLGAASGSS